MDARRKAWYERPPSPSPPLVGSPGSDAIYLSDADAAMARGPVHVAQASEPRSPSPISSPPISPTTVPPQSYQSNPSHGSVGGGIGALRGQLMGESAPQQPPQQSPQHTGVQHEYAAPAGVGSYSQAYDASTAHAPGYRRAAGSASVYEARHPPPYGGYTTTPCRSSTDLPATSSHSSAGAASSQPAGTSAVYGSPSSRAGRLMQQEGGSRSFTAAAVGSSGSSAGRVATEGIYSGGSYGGALQQQQQQHGYEQEITRRLQAAGVSPGRHSHPMGASTAESQRQARQPESPQARMQLRPQSAGVLARGGGERRASRGSHQAYSSAADYACNATTLAYDATTAGGEKPAPEGPWLSSRLGQQQPVTSSYSSVGGRSPSPISIHRQRLASDYYTTSERSPSPSQRNPAAAGPGQYIGSSPQRHGLGGQHGGGYTAAQYAPSAQFAPHYGAQGGSSVAGGHDAGYNAGYAGMTTAGSGGSGTGRGHAVPAGASAYGGCGEYPPPSSPAASPSRLLGANSYYRRPGSALAGSDTRGLGEAMPAAGQYPPAGLYSRASEGQGGSRYAGGYGHMAGAREASPARRDYLSTGASGAASYGSAPAYGSALPSTPLASRYQSEASPGAYRQPSSSGSGAPYYASGFQPSYGDGGQPSPYGARPTQGRHYEWAYGIAASPVQPSPSAAVNAGYSQYPQPSSPAASPSRLASYGTQPGVSVQAHQGFGSYRSH